MHFCDVQETYSRKSFGHISLFKASTGIPSHTYISHFPSIHGRVIGNHHALMLSRGGRGVSHLLLHTRKYWVFLPAEAEWTSPKLAKHRFAIPYSGNVKTHKPINTEAYFPPQNTKCEKYGTFSNMYNSTTMNVAISLASPQYLKGLHFRLQLTEGKRLGI